MGTIYIKRSSFASADATEEEGGGGGKMVCGQVKQITLNNNKNKLTSQIVEFALILSRFRHSSSWNKRLIGLG